MENYSVYEDIANRTGGDIYIGVVGPVRTGKSTFIKRFMEVMVLPNAAPKDRAVMTDELPQSAAGKTIMTTEPKFVPAKGAHISLAKGADVRVRLVDCVGFGVQGASGFEEDGAPRLVKTPWQEAPMPFEEAAAMGTEKVICEHSTIGVLVTTDGSVTDIPREGYEDAETRAAAKLSEQGKPFVIVLNCKNPLQIQPLKTELEIRYGVPVVALNAEMMGEAEIVEVLKTALFEFPVLRIDVRLPKWLQALPESHAMVDGALSAVKKAVENTVKMRDCLALEGLFDEESAYVNPEEIRMDLGKGSVEIFIGAKEQLFYQALGEACGKEGFDELSLLRYLRDTAHVQAAYDKVKNALETAEEKGYGVVCPDEGDFALDKPELVKKGSGYGVRFRARASGYHIVKVDVTGCVTPMIGTKEQSESFVEDTLIAYEDGEEKVWETNIFGKSLRTLVGEELSGKSGAMSEELRRKMRRTITRIVNDGKNNVLCILF